MYFTKPLKKWLEHHKFDFLYETNVHFDHIS